MSNDLFSIQRSAPTGLNLQPEAPASTNSGGQAEHSQTKPIMPEKAHIQYDAAQQRQQLAEAIDRLNDQAQQTQRNLHFSLSEELNRFVITVKNKQSGEVVRQIPDEVVLKIAQNIEQVKGLLWNESV